MAVSDGMSKLSDDLRKLSARAKEAEDHAAAARDKAKADIEADREDARAVGEQQAQALREKAEEGRDQISDRLGRCAEKLGRARRRRSAPTSSPVRQSTICTRPSAGPTGRRTRREYAIAFAYSAVVEAEYAVLDAALARVEAADLSKDAASGRLGRRTLYRRGGPQLRVLLRADPDPVRAYRCAVGAGARRYLLPMNRNRDRERVGTALGIATPRSPVRSRSHPSESRRSRADWCVARRFSSSYRRPRPTASFWSALPRAAARRCSCAHGSRPPSSSSRPRGLRSSRGERDAQHFWLSVIDAFAGAVDGSVERIGPTPGFRGEAVVERLLGSLRSVEEPLVLVIDDLHELQSPEALRWLELFIARRPANLRLVLTSRAEPAAQPASSAPRGELTEIRAIGPALLPRGGGRAAAGERHRALRRGGGLASRADGGLGRGPAAGGASRSTGIPTRSDSCASSPAASETSPVPDGRGAGAPAAGGARAPAADLDPRPGHRALGRRAHRPLAARSGSCSTSSRQMRSSPRSTPTARGFATTTSSPTSSARAAPHRPRQHRLPSPLGSSLV